MTETWTLQAIDYRGGTVEELDIKAECEDGREGVITMRRFLSCRWTAPLYLDIPPKMKRLALKICHEAVAW
ncbi:hypothetical protein [Mycobacteroides abscessus]|uniref:hypothetical protein n=1 Tax=Mycobacteroides abscessus TaxID=36809 RepID=UPI00139036F7|nr:hypothetical protein [Mycobacteroides abscessus]